MAVTALNVTTLVSQVAVAPATEVASDGTTGWTVQNSPTLWLEFTGTTATATTVSVVYAYTVDGQTVPNRTYSLPATAGAKRRAGPFPPALFGNTLSVLAPVSVTCAAYQLGS
jgi:hypothetical protein